MIRLLANCRKGYELQPKWGILALFQLTSNLVPERVFAGGKWVFKAAPG